MRCSTFHNDLKCGVEIDGIDYHFTDRKTMTTAIEKGNYYCIFKNINLGDHFLLKTLFSSFNFYFLKLRHIFEELTFIYGL